jgi:hypothetical protein|tara:strand:- start:1278 stop:1646 length:369 start_codon:yes stop_codon:yes gene_type:complete
MASRKKRRHQYAVYWAATGVDDYGEQTVSAPIELKVRWESEEQETTSADGQLVLTTEVVWVDRVISSGSILWFGKLIDLPSPLGGVDLLKVSAYIEKPDTKGRNPEQTIRLVRYSQTLPTVE